MKQFKKEPLVYLWGNTFPLFNAEAAIGYTILDDILAAKSELIFYIVDGYKVCFGKKRFLDEAKKYGDLFLKQAYFDTHVSEMNSLWKRRDKLISKINSVDLSKYSDRQLLELAKEYQDIFGRVFGHMVISRPECVDHLSEKLVALLSKQNKDNDEVNKHFTLLVSPTELDIIKKEQIARLKILGKQNEKNLIKHILNFPWVYGYKYTIAEAKKELQKDLKKEKKKILEQKIESFKAELSKIKKRKATVFKKYNDKEVRLLSQRLSFLGHNRLEVKSRFAGFLVTISPLFHEISKRKKVDSKKIINSCFLRDLENLLMNNKELSEKEIRERKTVILYTSSNAITSVQGKAAEKFAKKYLLQYIEDEKSHVSGTVASKGSVVGKVRKIILTDDMDMDSFEKGEILVTEMTAPSMVPLMNRCAGIITNEGGIVSHAAIISREYKIPCVVGTGTATQVFETGDYIELNANKGTAKKITETELSRRRKNISLIVN